MIVSVKYVRKNPVRQARRTIICFRDQVCAHRARAEDPPCTLHGCSKPLPAFVCTARAVCKRPNAAGSACRMHQCVRLRTISPGVRTYSCFCDAAGFILGKHEHGLPPDTCMSCRRSQCFCMGCTGGLWCFFVFISCAHGARSSSKSLHGRFKRRASDSVSSRTCNGVFSALNS